MKITALLAASILLTACAAPDEKDDRREETAIADFIATNELESVNALRTLGQLSSRDVSDLYIIVSARREDFLLEYYSRCVKRFDGRVEPDIRQDSNALYPKIDTFRGCRIKAIYALQPGQADEIRNLGRSVGGDR
jgi:hypothetical protein